MSQVNSAFFFKMRWEDCNNYVAKRYLADGVGRERYFDDIKMQVRLSRSRHAPCAPHTACVRHSCAALACSARVQRSRAVLACGVLAG